MNFAVLGFYKKLNGVRAYVYGLKYDEHNPEIGYLYDNKREYQELLEKMQKLNIQDPEVIAFLEELKADLDEVERRKTNPVRNSEEEAFYKHIVGVNSFVREKKQANPKFLYDNFNEAEELLRKFAELKTKNPNIHSDIIGIMALLTRDIKKVIELVGREEFANEYQQHLDALGIVPVEVIRPVGIEKNIKEKTM